MVEPQESTQLLNVYEVVTEDGLRHLVCFLDPERADAEGIDPCSVVGEFTPGPGQSFDPATFLPNTVFVEAFKEYMDEEAMRSPELSRAALEHADDWLYVLDPRFHGVHDGEPPAGEILGGYAVDGSGQIIPGSFLYNERHRWFDPVAGVSGVLFDRRFYDWLHAGAAAVAVAVEEPVRA
jgi:hypothetical protein